MLPANVPLVGLGSLLPMLFPLVTGRSLLSKCPVVNLDGFTKEDLVMKLTAAQF